MSHKVEDIQCGFSTDPVQHVVHSNESPCATNTCAAVDQHRTLLAAMIVIHSLSEIEQSSGIDWNTMIGPDKEVKLS